MSSRSVLISILLMTLTGCVSGKSASPLWSHHPANAAVDEVPLPAPSKTLANTDTPAVSDVNPSMPEMQMQGEHDMSGMHHGMNHAGMRHSSEKPMSATRPNETAAPSALRGAAASQPATTQATVYTCVMHPEVISDKPGKCPKCGMTLVKKESR